jgi:hypothetical protein
MTQPQTDPLLTSYLNDVNLLYKDWQTAFQVDTEVARYSVTDDDPGAEEAKRTAMVTWIDAQKSTLLEILQAGSQTLCQRWQTFRGQHDSFHENQHLLIALTTDIAYMWHRYCVSVPL